MIDEIREFIGGLLGAVLFLVIFAILIATAVNIGLAPEPGDPFFPAWLDVTRYGWRALVLIIPGVGAAVYVVLGLLPDSGGF